MKKVLNILAALGIAASHSAATIAIFSAQTFVSTIVEFSGTDEKADGTDYIVFALAVIGGGLFLYFVC